MLELYHSINSVCAQKIRLALNEKKLACNEHLMKLNGDQFDPAYLKLNPNGVVPTLIHDPHLRDGISPGAAADPGSPAQCRVCQVADQKARRIQGGCAHARPSIN